MGVKGQARSAFQLVPRQKGSCDRHAVGLTILSYASMPLCSEILSKGQSLLNFPFLIRLAFSIAGKDASEFFKT